MSIVEKTRIALLALFPEQAAADAEARARAEAESAVEKEIEAAAAEMAAIELTPGEESATEEGGEEAVSPDASASSGATEPEPEPVEEEEGPREVGVMLTEHGDRGSAIDVLCDPEQVVEAASIMDSGGFFLESITGVDWIKEKKMEVIYDYNQYGADLCRVVVRTFVERDNPELATISEVFPSADWHERETHDFYGINFQGHPNLIPILLPEDADFHPLLKDFKP